MGEPPAGAAGAGSGPAAASAASGGFWITAIAASTGGPEALSRVIPRLPADYPVPIVIVQHMPPVFTRHLAASLDGRSRISVREGRDGQILRPGHAYVAPGGRHMLVQGRGPEAVLRLNDDPPEQSVRPAANVLFRSLAGTPSSPGVLAVILTGMGVDGLAGVRSLKTGRCRCLTQSEATCVVYGMPRAVVLAGLGDECLALDDLAARMSALVGVRCAPAC